MQKRYYYPFGLQQKGYNDVVTSNSNSVANRFGYGGKELGDELGLNWYDVSARNYDSAIGRWMNIDPLAELMTRHSPYNYAFDNPVFFIDPDGMAPCDPDDPNCPENQTDPNSNSGIPGEAKYAVAGGNKGSSNRTTSTEEDSEEDSEEKFAGTGFSFVTDDGTPSGLKSLIRKTIGMVRVINVTGIMMLADLAKGKKKSKGERKEKATLKRKPEDDNVADKLKKGSDAAGKQKKRIEAFDKTTDILGGGNGTANSESGSFELTQYLSKINYNGIRVPNGTETNTVSTLRKGQRDSTKIMNEQKHINPAFSVLVDSVTVKRIKQ